MSEMTSSQLNTFSDEIILNSQKIKNNASQLQDTSKLMASVIQCGDVAEQLQSVMSNVATTLEDVGDQMNRVGIAAREAAELQKNREVLGV